MPAKKNQFSHCLYATSILMANFSAWYDVLLFCLFFQLFNLMLVNEGLFSQAQKRECFNLPIPNSLIAFRSNTSHSKYSNHQQQPSFT
jgi:hypothetical protein